MDGIFKKKAKVDSETMPTVYLSPFSGKTYAMSMAVPTPNSNATPAEVVGPSPKLQGMPTTITMDEGTGVKSI